MNKQGMTTCGGTGWRSVEHRLGNVEKTLDHVIELQVQMVDLLKGQQEQLNHQQQQIDRMQQNLESMNRFNIQTRRLWILIARKANWFDEDESKQVGAGRPLI